mgnify:CR=1 FL=1
MAILRTANRVLDSFVDFLDRSNIISSAAAFVLGISANKFFGTVTDQTVVNAINAYSSLSDTRLRFGRVEVHYGLILVQLINLVAVSLTIFAFVSAAKFYLGWT